MKKIIGVVLLALVCCNTNRNLVPPQDAAKKFAEDTKIGYQGSPSCTGVDTDGDGYVTCTFSLAEPKDGKDRISIQCADITTDGCGDGHSTTYAVGCKDTEPKVRAIRTGS